MRWVLGTLSIFSITVILMFGVLIFGVMELLNFTLIEPAKAAPANTKSVFTAVSLDVYSPHDDTPHSGGASCSEHADGLRLVKTHLEGKLIICEWR